MSAVNWTKISNNLADSTDWEYISSQIKIELKLDIDPAFSMFVFEEYLKLAHKKNNPCVKGAEFISRTFNTKHLFFATNKLDYETFDKLIKFINKKLIEVKKLNKKYEIVKFYDYYNDDKKNVSNMSSSMSSNVSNDVSNMSAKKNDDILMTKRKLQNKLAQAKRRVKMGLGTQLNLEKIQAEYDLFVSSMSANVSKKNTMSANVSNNVSKCHGGERGGYRTYNNIRNKERIKKCSVRMSTMSANQKKECQQKMSTNTHNTFSSFEEKNDRLQQSAPTASNCFNVRDFMNVLEGLEKISVKYNKPINFDKMDFDKLKFFDNGKELSLTPIEKCDRLLLILNNCKKFNQSILSNNFQEIKGQFDKMFQLLDENTTTPFIQGATTQEKKEKKQQMLFEIYNEAKTNSQSSLSAVYHFLLKYYGKKKDNGYNLDCPTYMDYIQYLKDNGSVYLERANKIQVNITALEEKIKLLKNNQKEKSEDIKGFDAKIHNILNTNIEEEIYI